MRRRLGVVAAMAAVIGGCSINQKAPLTTAANMCNFKEHRLAVGVPDTGNAFAMTAQTSSLAMEIEQALEARDEVQAFRLAAGLEPDPSSMLFLSGGSEHGAYGAGILKGWGGDGRIPEMQVVTGISTGAILSSFAFVGKGDFAADGYTIDNEDQLLHVYSKPREGKPAFGNFADLLKNGAFANLDPLGQRKAMFLTRPYTLTGPDGVERSTYVLQEVGNRHADGARLYVGAVDLDTGQGVAFDMGDMALRYVTAANGGDEKDRTHWLDCYVSAIIASSSTPMAAPPVFIDNTMYVDGGARFGLFGDAFREVFDARKEQVARDAGAAPPPRVYAVVNGTLKLPAPKCPKKNPADCTGSPAKWQATGQHKDWNILNLMLGSERVLVNQVYRFSAMAAQDEACEDSGCFNFLRIDPDVADFKVSFPAPLNAGRTGDLSCYDWMQVDIETDNPIQFHKRYMRCLIRYGEARVQAAGWGS